MCFQVSHPVRRHLILVVRAMVVVFVIFFFALIISSLISGFSNFTLIQNLKDFYPQAYSSAGSPTMRFFLGPGVNVTWQHYLLSGKFRTDPLTPPQLMEAYVFAYWSGWFTIVTFAAFFTTLVISLAV